MWPDCRILAIKPRVTPDEGPPIPRVRGPWFQRRGDPDCEYPGRTVQPGGRGEHAHRAKAGVQFSIATNVQSSVGVDSGRRERVVAVRSGQGRPRWAGYERSSLEEGRQSSATGLAEGGLSKTLANVHTQQPEDRYEGDLREHRGNIASLPVGDQREAAVTFL